jgi:hypothetical protein
VTSSTSLPPLGADRPRIELGPSSTGTLGGVAIALATKAGIPPEPWQADGLNLMMAIREDGLWAADEYTEWLGRQEGKTGGILMPRALSGFLVLGEPLLMWSAHLYATALEAFLLGRTCLRRLGEAIGPNLIDLGDGVVVKVNNTNGEEGFERLDTGARWRFLARSKASGRGFTGDTNIIDEAFAYTSVQQAALAPTMTARPNPQTVYASTPPLDKWTGDVMFELRRRALAGEVEGLAYRDWGLAMSLDELLELPEEKRKAILDDRSLWLRTCPAIGRGRVTMESIARLRRTLKDIDFAREVLGMWPKPPDEAGGKIAPTVWGNLTDPTSQVASRPVFTIEVSQDGTTASILAGGRRADDLVHVELIDDRPGAGLGWVVDRVAELDATRDPLAWLVDPTGPAGALLPDLKAGPLDGPHKGRSIEPTQITGREYVQACRGFVNAVTGATVRHLGQGVVDKVIPKAHMRNVGDGGEAWARRDSPVDIARVIGLTLVHHGVLLLTTANYDVMESVW